MQECRMQNERDSADVEENAECRTDRVEQIQRNRSGRSERTDILHSCILPSALRKQVLPSALWKEGNSLWERS